jgi:hypothetical protein
MGALALQIKAYNTKLRTESIINDVFEKLSAIVDYSEKGANVPDAIFLKMEKQVTGAHSTTFPLLMRLRGAPSHGPATLIGKEETLRLRHLTVYYNLIRKAVATETYGVNANDVSAYDLYGQIGPLMVDYFSELRGKRIREASMLTVAAELTEDPIFLKHRFNDNIFVPNTALGGMPVFDTRDEVDTVGANYPGADAALPFKYDSIADGSGSYVANICTTLKAATSNWTHPEYAQLSIESLLALDYHCVENLKLEPIMIGGQATLVFALPSTQMIKLLNPTGSQTNIGYIWKEVMALQKIEQMIPGAYCRVRHLLLVEDTRYATLTVAGDGTTPAWTLTPGFLCPGNTDGRNHAPFNSSSNLVFDVGCVYAKGGIVEWIVSQLKYATEAYDYEMVKGKGAYTCAGIMLAQYNVDPTSPQTDQVATQYNRGTCLVIMSKPTLVTVTP